MITKINRLLYSLFEGLVSTRRLSWAETMLVETELYGYDLYNKLLADISSKAKQGRRSLSYRVPVDLITRGGRNYPAPDLLKEQLEVDGFKTEIQKTAGDIYLRIKW